jgi:hypothetical protein
LVNFYSKPEATPEQIAALKQALLALKGKIPVIVDVSAGINVTERAKGFNFGLTVIITSKEGWSRRMSVYITLRFPIADLPTYAQHPAHQACIKEFIDPIREETMALDYVVD